MKLDISGLYEEYKVESLSQLYIIEKILFTHKFVWFWKANIYHIDEECTDIITYKNYENKYLGRKEKFYNDMIIQLYYTYPHQRTINHTRECLMLNKKVHEILSINQFFNKWRLKMNELIIDMFPATKDAVLIEKWFGSRIENDPLTKLLIKGKETELLEEARKLEKEEIKS